MLQGCLNKLVYTDLLNSTILQIWNLTLNITLKLIKTVSLKEVLQEISTLLLI